ARREERDEVKHAVGGLNEPVARGLGDSEVREELGLLLGRELRDIHLGPPAHRDDVDAERAGRVGDRRRDARGDRRLVEVEQGEKWLLAEEAEARERGLLLGSELERAQRL